MNGSLEVTSWADQSGSGDPNRNVAPTGTDKPALVAADALYNGQSTVGTFNKAGVANDCRLRSLGTWSATFSAFTIIVVGHATGGGVNRYFTHEQNSDYISIVGNVGSSVVRAYSGTATVFLQSGPTPTTPRFMIAEYNGASSKLFVDSFSAPSATGTLDASTLGNAPVYLGSYPSSATTYGVDAIAEVIAYASLFSTWPVADQRTLGAYLNSRYGRSVTLP